MVHFASPLLLLTALAAAEDITAELWMTAPNILDEFVVQYAGSVVNVEEGRSTILATGSVIVPPPAQSSVGSYYEQWFDKQATRFTLSGTTAFEYKSAWANGMYVNIIRCEEYEGALADPVLCTDYIHAAWLETLCTAWEEDKNLVADQVTRTTVDDVGSTWTISGPNPAWTEECVEGSDYIGDPGSGRVRNRFSPYSLYITAGGEKLAAQTGAVPTPTDASRTESPTSASSGSEAASASAPSGSEAASGSPSSGSEGALSTVIPGSHIQSTGTGVPHSITGAGNTTLIGTGTPPVQTTSAGFKNTPMMGLLMSVLMAFLFTL